MIKNLALRSFRSNCINYRKFCLPTAVIMAERTYEDAVKALNSLQTNAQVLAEIRKTRGRRARDNLEEMRNFTKRAGVTMEMLDKLSVIHVSGTKGKVGSPHLIEVRERIRLNGRPLSKDLFTKYFFDCWDNLQATADDHHSSKMPAYFRFLTLMSFYVFLKEKVDVAVVEVGIGGAYDSTNIIRKPVVCGVTSLGMDHVETLGGTLESIAWQKAGIFKLGVPAFTVEQEESALDVIRERAREIKNSVHVIPRLESYPGPLPVLGVSGKHQHVNASMALQLSYTWLQNRKQVNNSNNNPQVDEEPIPKRPRHIDSLVAPTFEITDEMRKGLESAVWRGRTETIKRPSITFYLDGAHTPRSMEACVEWFKQQADKEVADTNGPVARILLFNLTGGRDPHGLLRPLINLKFDHAVFSPNAVNMDKVDSSDLSNFTVTRDSQLRWCVENQRVWMALRGAGFQAHASLDDDHVIKNGHDDGEYSAIFPCVAQAIRWIAAGRDPLIPTIANGSLEYPESVVNAARVQVLVAGSLHLVGTVMKVLGTEITGEI
ncbi:Folylpolyglutamate synthase, mitochondrial [Exaiptasia diaphana]|nr:Folylpolyglutamate synthase, mitochondrial [Exaiptasia diaphana]